MNMTFDFEDGNGPVSAKQHSNGGGWVADTATVSDTAYVGANAWVFGYARVYGSARVYDDARVFGYAHIYDTAWVFGYARVYGNADVYGDACVFDNARVYGNADVYGDARVYGNARVFDDARVFGYAHVYGNADVHGDVRISLTPPRAPRSDGYDFVVVPDSSGTLRVLAGCRYFTFEEARAHWTETRSDTLIGEETMDILDYLEIRARKLYANLLDTYRESC